MSMSRLNYYFLCVFSNGRAGFWGQKAWLVSDLPGALYSVCCFVVAAILKSESRTSETAMAYK